MIRWWIKCYGELAPVGYLNNYGSSVSLLPVCSRLSADSTPRPSSPPIATAPSCASSATQWDSRHCFHWSAQTGSTLNTHHLLVFCFCILLAVSSWALLSQHMATYRLLLVNLCTMGMRCHLYLLCMSCRLRETEGMNPCPSQPFMHVTNLRSHDRIGFDAIVSPEWLKTKQTEWTVCRTVQSFQWNRSRTKR